MAARTYTDITIQSTKRGAAKHSILVVENVFGACAIESHDGCMNGYDVMLSSNCVAICSCKCHGAA